MALSFDGSNDEVTLATQTITSGIISISAWIKPAGMGESNQGCLFGNSTDMNWRFNASAGSNKLRITWNYTGTDAIWDMATAVTLNAWNHVGFAHDGSTTAPTFYLNGVAVSTTTVSAPTGSSENNSATWRCGENSGGTMAFNGLIGEFVLYKSTLTAVDFAAFYAIGSAVEPGMYLYWPMDNSGSAQATDYSGNARNGTVTGPVTGENPPIRVVGRHG